MNVADELALRCARRRNEKIGPLSERAYEELLLTVRENPEMFIDDAAEQAFSYLGRALRNFRDAARDDEFLDDEQYMAQRNKRFSALVGACNAAISLDDGCLDAHLLRALAMQKQPDALLDELMGLERRFDDEERPVEKLSWDDVFDRPRLRLRAAVARTCEDGARHRMALSAAESVMQATEAAGDPLGARYTAAIALARLEDEDGFNALDARFGGHDNAWGNLARAILLYKLDRLPAARRALRGYARLCEGAEYALLRPIYVEIYLPDRPDYAHGSFEEALAAVHEAEPTIADTPDFIAWCQEQQWFVDAAKSFAESRDLDW